MGRARAALFGNDLDYTIRRFRTVQRTGGRPLDDLDGFDVFGADVIEARDDVAALLTRAGADVVRNADTVDVDQRLLRQRERRAAANVDHRATARSPRPTRDDHTRCTPVDETSQIADRRGAHLVRGRDRGDRISA